MRRVAVLRSATLIFLLGLVSCGPQGEPKDHTPGAKDADSRRSLLHKGPSLESGKRLFSRCQSCHTLQAGGRHRVGPNLHGIFGRQTASHPDFNYSKAMREADFRWTPEKLDLWLANPQTFLPGSNMTFAGLRRAKDREILIQWLQQQTEPGPEELE